jgi:hypothetical protein
MADQSTELLRLLAHTEHILATAKALAETFPVGSDEERQLTLQIVELREAVDRIEKVLSETKGK